MSSVAVLERHNIGILIGVVVAECDLVTGNVTVVYLSRLKTTVELISLSTGKELCDHITIIMGILDLIACESGV